MASGFDLQYAEAILLIMEGNALNVAAQLFGARVGGDGGMSGVCFRAFA
jgi:hypothetical protein